jgi:hypothetical protein
MVTDGNNIHQTSVPTVPKIVPFKAHCGLWKSSMRLKRILMRKIKRNQKIIGIPVKMA